MAACGTSAVPRELGDARAAYQHAAGGVAAELDPADVRAARSELADAESTYRRLGNIAETRDLAEVAARRARIAEARAAGRVENACSSKPNAVTLTSAQVSPPASSALELGEKPDFEAVDRFAKALAPSARVTIEIPSTLEARDLAASVRAHLVGDGVTPSNITVAESSATTKPVMTSP